MDSNSGFRFSSPFARSRERPRLPAELVDMKSEDYAAQLRIYGYSERAIEKELLRLRNYIERVTPRDLTPDVEPGPVKGQLFNDWARAVRKRRIRKEPTDDEASSE